MEWVDGLRCTDPDLIRSSGLDVQEFIRGGVRTGLRMLLEVCLRQSIPFEKASLPVITVCLGEPADDLLTFSLLIFRARFRKLQYHVWPFQQRQG